MAGVSSTRWIASLAVLAAGVAAAVWLYLAGSGEVLAAAARLDPLSALALVGLTIVCLLLRFLRWQYLLRRAGVLVPIRPSFTGYLASLAGIATPAYVGETLRCILLRRSFRVPLRRTLPLWVAERALDFAAIAAWVGVAQWDSSLALWITLGGGAALVAVSQLARDGSMLDRASPVIATFAVSLLAWFPAMFLVQTAAEGLGFSVGMAEGFRIYGLSTLGGGISLMPAGIGTMGGLAIVQLEGVGLGLTQAVAVVSVVRLATVGLTLAIGVAFLFPELVRLGRSAKADRSFDVIADEYLDQFSPHIWDLLLERKTQQMRGALGNPAPDGIGLDLGCGLGFQAGALRDHGYRVVGLDPAHKLVKQAVARGVPAFTGDALSIPIASNSLDFVYSVGVLHHLPTYAAQDVARSEVWRVLKPGGAFIILETNPRNPLFRLYMSYLFPLLRSIDEGIELWLDDDRWADVPGFSPEPVRYFTFLPDFLPRPLLRAALPLERALERSAFGRFSVHYMAVLRKVPMDTPPARAVASRATVDA